jgi:hypothetical protein
VNRPMGPGQRGNNREGGVHAAKALILIVVVVAIGLVVLHHSQKTTTAATRPTSSHSKGKATTTTTPPAPTTSTTLVPVASIKLQVLNGVGVGQLAGEWSAKLRRSPGYDTLAADNATATVSASEIFVMTPGYTAEADALAVTIGLTPAIVNPTVPAPASAPIPATERAKANIVLVIGPNLASRA